MRIGQCEQAIAKYKESNLIRDNRDNFYRTAICYCYLGNTNSAVSSFREALQRGFYYSFDGQSLETDTYLKCLQEHPDFQLFVHWLDSNRRGFMRNFNPELQQAFLERRDIDQNIRQKRFGDTTDEMFAETLSSMRFIDSINMLYLDSMLDVYQRWIGYDLIGTEGDNAAWTIAQHADDYVTFQEKCYQYLLEAFDNYNTHPNNVAYLYDRIQVNKNLQQKYGTQVRVIEGKIIFINLDDEEYVEIYRHCFGLPPLSFYKKSLEEIYLKE
ncbi:MAG: hypothetical protein LBQ64_01445 [Bacteroidales bacterium]|nr:hypothetical protein [Bacteroidales bacterium]